MQNKAVQNFPSKFKCFPPPAANLGGHIKSTNSDVPVVVSLSVTVVGLSGVPNIDKVPCVRAGYRARSNAALDHCPRELL